MHTSDLKNPANFTTCPSRAIYSFAKSVVPYRGKGSHKQWGDKQESSVRHTTGQIIQVILVPCIPKTASKAVCGRCFFLDRTNLPWLLVCCIPAWGHFFRAAHFKLLCFCVFNLLLWISTNLRGKRKLRISLTNSKYQEQLKKKNKWKRRCLLIEVSVSSCTYSKKIFSIHF